MKHDIVALLGPSGVGKGAIRDQLLNLSQCGIMFRQPVSLTTRKLRPNEKEGGQYIQVSHNEFHEKVRQNLILTNVRYDGNHYAYLKETVDDVIKSGAIPILDLQIQTIHSVRRYYHDASIAEFFLTTRSMDELRKRLENRPRSGFENYHVRITQAKNEILKAWQYGIPIYINAEGKLDKTIEEILEVLGLQIPNSLTVA